MPYHKCAVKDMCECINFSSKYRYNNSFELLAWVIEGMRVVVSVTEEYKKPKLRWEVVVVFKRSICIHPHVQGVHIKHIEAQTRTCWSFYLQDGCIDPIQFFLLFLEYVSAVTCAARLIAQQTSGLVCPKPCKDRSNGTELVECSIHRHQLEVLSIITLAYCEFTIVQRLN